MKRIYFAILSIIVLGVGCIKKNDFNFSNIKYTNWTPDWAIPFISTQLTMRNMLNNNTVISTDSTSGLLSLHYTARGFSFKAADYIKIPDQHFTTPSIALSTPITSLPVAATVSDSFSNSFSYFDSSGSHLAHIGLKGGSIHVNLSSTYNQNINFVLTFPNIKNGATPLQVPVTITYPSISSDVTIDLTGYTIDMTNGGTTNNYLGYKINYTLTGTGQSISTSADMIAMVDLTSLQYSFLDGSIGHYEIPFPDDTINVGILNKAVSANIRLLNPKLHMLFSSSFGLSVSAKFDSLYGYSITGIIDTIKIPSMLIKGDSFVSEPTVFSNYTIDSTTSNLRNILSPVPNYIIYNGQISINPTGSSGYNFITDTSTINLTLDAELPAAFQILQLALQDTVKMQMPPDTSLLTKAQFAVQVTNAFPVYATIQLYFTDSNYVVLDSLITPNGNIIPAAPVDANGIVNDSTARTSYFTLERTRYMAMASRIRHGIIRGNLNTSGTNSVQMHATDHLRVKTAFRFSLDYGF